MIRRVRSIFHMVILVALTLAAVGTGVLWVDSFRAAKVHTAYANGESWTEVSINRGVLEILTLESQNAPHFDVFVRAFAYSRGLIWAKHGQVGRPLTAKALARLPAGINAKGAAVPLGLPFVLLAGYPTIAFIRGLLRRRRQGREGLCIHCGYNLTGNVSGRCSECGEAILDLESATTLGVED